MSPGDSQFHSRVIVVADRDSDFVKEMDHLVAEYDLAAAQCDDIYSAATELARHPDRFLMVTGVFRQLIRGKGDFFTLAERNGVQCCCLLDKESGVERDKLLAAVRLGVRLAGEVADIRQFLEDRLAADGCRGSESDREDLRGEPFLATEDELKALLRQETNE